MAELDTSPLECGRSLPVSVAPQPPVSTEGLSREEPDGGLREGPNLVPVAEAPVSVFDVAAYILSKKGPLSTIKLQKLVYYCQAWSLVWDEARLFGERIEAWVNGPVVRDLYAYHRGMFQIDSVPIGVAGRLGEDQRKTVDAVLDFYGGMSGQELVATSHLEAPWRQARKGLGRDERGSAEISLESMHEYYTSISVE